MEFTLIDRLGIITSMPGRASALELKTSRDIIDKLAPTEKERKDYAIVQSGDKIEWNNKGEKAVVDIEIADSESDLIWKSLQKLDADGELPFRMLSLYEKFDKTEEGDS